MKLNLMKTKFMLSNLSLSRLMILSVCFFAFSIAAQGQSGGLFSVPSGSFVEKAQAETILSDHVETQKNLWANEDPQAPNTLAAKRKISYLQRVLASVEKNVSVAESIVRGLRTPTAGAANYNEAELLDWRNTAINMLKK